MDVKQLTIKEFSTKIKEEGVDYKTVIITPSLDVDEEIEDILDFLREYRDRTIWNENLYNWLEKHNFLNEFKEYYYDE